MNESGVYFAILPLLLLLVGAIIAVAILAFWIWVLVDCVKNPRLTDNERVIWIIVIVLTSWLGALIYIIVGRKK